MNVYGPFIESQMTEEKESFVSATLTITNPIWTGVKPIPGLCDKRPSTVTASASFSQ